MMPMTAVMTQMVVATKVTSNSHSNKGKDRTHRMSTGLMAIRRTSCTIHCHTNHSHLLLPVFQPYAHPCVFRLGK